MLEEAAEVATTRGSAQDRSNAPERSTVRVCLGAGDKTGRAHSDENGRRGHATPSRSAAWMR